MNNDKREIIQAYFFSKNQFREDSDIIKYLIENEIPTIQKISDSKFYYKIKLLSEKKLKLQGYTIIRKQLKENIQVNVAFKQPLKQNFIEFK
jgi:hypothetical protein